MSICPTRPPLIAAAFVLLCLVPAKRVTAQVPTRPTQEQAQELLRTRPELVTQLQQRLRASGMTPEQVRARLRAEGYPESLLDAYLPGGRAQTPADTAGPSTLLGAIEALGVADSADVAMLRETAGLTILADSTEGITEGARPRMSPRDSAERARRDSLDPEIARDSGRIVFGQDLFRQRTSLFEPNL